MRNSDGIFAKGNKGVDPKGSQNRQTAIREVYKIMADEGHKEFNYES